MFFRMSGCRSRTAVRSGMLDGPSAGISLPAHKTRIVKIANRLRVRLILTAISLAFGFGFLPECLDRPDDGKNAKWRFQKRFRVPVVRDPQPGRSTVPGSERFQVPTAAPGKFRFRFRGSAQNPTGSISTKMARSRTPTARNS